MSKYVVKLHFVKDEVDYNEYIECDSIEQFSEAKKDLENEDLEITLYVLKEVSLEKEGE